MTLPADTPRTASVPKSSSRQSTGAPERPRLGEILVAGGAITAAQLEHALTEQAAFQLPLGQTLLKLGYTTDETMRQALSSQLGVPYIDLQNVIIDRSLAELLDRDYARQHALFPVARIGKALTVAMDDPTATSVVDELGRMTGHAITVVTSSAEAIQRALVRLYDKSGAAGAPASTPGDGAPTPTPKRPVLTSHGRTQVMPAAGEHGYVALLGLMTFELPSLLRSIEGGLAFRVFDAFVEQTGFSEERAAEFADISRRVLGERRTEGRFTRDESDRLVRAARIFGGALRLFNGDRTTASAWLVSGQPALGGSVPFELARTDLGAREVESALSALASKRTRG
jgi:putative toxin-antitoxin system antitoxin component (TIGR02293 family)